MKFFVSPEQAGIWYDTLRVNFVALCIAAFPTTLFVDAPYGRFSPSSDSWMMIDGRISWVCMELVAPLTFIYTFLTSPLSDSSPRYTARQLVLAGAFLVHYLNRALISPYRTPSRSKAHIAVPLSGMSFNVVNGFLLGAYISSPAAYASPSRFASSWTFPVGLAIWAVGLIGNIAHDEILIDIRRNQSKKGKAAAEGEKRAAKKEHYAIPHGLLYKYISFPNYLCEYIEWIGFALVASGGQPPIGGEILTWHNPAAKWLPGLVKVPALSPPWAFVLNTVLVTFPRAYRGHKWYRATFGEEFPKERKIIIPWLL